MIRCSDHAQRKMADVPRATSREIAPGVVADLDKEGNIVALEILDASDCYSPEDWHNSALRGLQHRAAVVSVHQSPWNIERKYSVNHKRSIAKVP